MTKTGGKTRKTKWSGNETHWNRSDSMFHEDLIQEDALVLTSQSYNFSVASHKDRMLAFVFLISTIFCEESIAFQDGITTVTYEGKNAPSEVSFYTTN